MAATIPIFILLVTAGGLFFPAATAAASIRSRQRIAPALAWTGIIGSAVACLRLWGHRVSVYGWVESDRLGQFLSLVILVGLGLAMPALMSQRKLVEQRPGRFAEFVGWFFLSSAAMLLVCSTRNLGMAFVALEILCVAVPVISGRGRTKPSGSFFELGNRMGSILILLGLATLVVTLRTLDLAAMETHLVNPSISTRWAPAAGLTCVVFGLVVKLVAIVSRATAAEQKNVASLGILATLTHVAIFGFLLRATGWLLSLAEPAAAILGVVAVLGVSVGNGLGLHQRCVERRLAYCSLTHIGYLSLGVAVGGVEARSSVLLYLLVYTLMSVGVFSVVSSLEADRRRWRGLAWAQPLSGLAMTLFLLSLAAIAPTAGGIARLYLFATAVAGDYLLLVAVGLAGSLVGVYCYSRILFVLYDPAASLMWDARPLGKGGKLSLVVMCAGVFAIGILPEPWLAWVHRAALEFF